MLELWPTTGEKKSLTPGAPMHHGKPRSSQLRPQGLNPWMGNCDMKICHVWSFLITRGIIVKTQMTSHRMLYPPVGKGWNSLISASERSGWVRAPIDFHSTFPGSRNWWTWVLSQLGCVQWFRNIKKIPQKSLDLLWGLGDFCSLHPSLCRGNLLLTLFWEQNHGRLTPFGATLDWNLLETRGDLTSHWDHGPVLWELVGYLLFINQPVPKSWKRGIYAAPLIFYDHAFHWWGSTKSPPIESQSVTLKLVRGGSNILSPHEQLYGKNKMRIPPPELWIWLKMGWFSNSFHERCFDSTCSL